LIYRRNNDSRLRTTQLSDAESSDGWVVAPHRMLSSDVSRRSTILMRALSHLDVFRAGTGMWWFRSRSVPVAWRSWFNFSEDGIGDSSLRASPIL
jgi:hypothetical protein